MTRKEIKRQAKDALAKNRGNSILAMLLPIIIYFGLYLIPFGLFRLTGQFIFLTLLYVLALAFVPITVGICHFFYRFKDDPEADLKLLLKGYENFFRSLGRLLQTWLFIYLWTLLLIIPGLIAIFSYAMVPYILGDDDIQKGLDGERPTIVSRRMMKGHRWELFVMWLSFIGWIILGVLTFGILLIVFVGPYINQSYAIFYEKVKKNLPEKYFVPSES